MSDSSASLPSPEVPADGASAQPAAPRPRRGLIRRLVTPAIVLACVTGGAALSQQLRPKPAPETAEPHTDADAPPAPDAHPAPNAPPTPADRATAGRVNNSIRAASYSYALKLIRGAAPGAFGDEHQAAYREGLCLEGLNRLKEADAAYQKAEQDPNVGGWARATLGRARCAIDAGTLTEARALMDRVLLRSGHQECRGSKFREEVAYLRARVCVLELGSPAPLDPLNAGALAWPAMQVEPDVYLDWLASAESAASPSPDTGRDVVEVHADKDPQNPTVTLRLAKQPALDAVHALASAAQLEVSEDDTVAKLLADPVGPVEVERLPLGVVLTALTERARVKWEIKGRELLLAPAPYGTGPELTVQALRQALEVAAEHPAAAPMRVTLANLDARAGRFRVATLGYRQVFETVGHAPAAPHAAYNLGLMEMKAGNRKSAVARFFEVIDRAPGTTFAEFAWCWIGRSHLEDDAPEAARRAYVTAYNGNNKEAVSAAALGVCMCDLLTGNEGAVRELMADAKLSTREPHAMITNYYTALLRYRTAPSESRKELLFRAIDAADEGRALGPGGVYLTGRVYTELGLTREMCSLYEREVETARGPLALRMLYEVAERYDRLDARSAARARYLSVAAVDQYGLRARAELRLAALDARDGNGEDAVRRCWVLTKSKDVPLEDVLRVMGHGYELQGMYRAAADCFAGRLPE
ncbi:tetratricopeptide repeat protein [Gemmata obscuriglobus]|uniref:tetratricopeptide repeat protein n=1 Tax=Gemmata obscuriglobus TaxID=114 RepID=UPI00016C4A62|nr:hypothetical protein [Gemmata obscuriglobus]